MAGQLEGKVAFITGAASGIGKAAAGLFASEGAGVAIADVNSEAGKALEAAIKDEGGSAIFVHTDVTSAQSMEAAIESTVRRFGHLDIVYNNAGGSRPADGPITETSDEAFWTAIQIDLFGTWLGCKYGILKMRASGGGTIVNTSSMVAFIGGPRAAYTCAKGGVAALTRNLAAHYAKDGIRVNALAPGVTRTERIAKKLGTTLIPDGHVGRSLLGVLEPIQIARSALFLASDQSAGMTGHVMHIDSGVTIA